MDETLEAVLVGGVIGGIVGAAIGSRSEEPKGALKGAAVGALFLGLGAGTLVELAGYLESLEDPNNPQQYDIPQGFTNARMAVMALRELPAKVYGLVEEYGRMAEHAKVSAYMPSRMMY